VLPGLEIHKEISREVTVLLKSRLILKTFVLGNGCILSQRIEAENATSFPRIPYSVRVLGGYYGTQIDD